jgi:hypothetical protein
VQRLHDADPGEHHWPAVLGNQQQRFGQRSAIPAAAAPPLASLRCNGGIGKSASLAPRRGAVKKPPPG